MCLKLVLLYSLGCLGSYMGSESNEIRHFRNSSENSKKYADVTSMIQLIDPCVSWPIETTFENEPV